MTETLALLLRMNLAVALAVVVVLALRLPLRRLCGAEAAYGLWSLVPLAALAMLAPARTMTVGAPVAAAPMIEAAALPPSAPAQAGFEAAPWLAGLWLAGAAAGLFWLARRQAQFDRAVREGRAGPAVVGVLRPRIVLPADFAQRYSLAEQRVILAHERAHIARQDPRINALVALARRLAWFNPLLHVLERYLRIDQELACDAQVIAAHPADRRAYAEAMLKAQLAARPLPLGCYWPAPSRHPLAQRIALLARRTPSRARRWTGAGLVLALGLGVSLSAWAARPPRLVVTAASAPAGAAIAPTAAPPPAAPRRRPPHPAAPPAAPAAPSPASAEAAAPAEPAGETEAAQAGFRPRVRAAAERSFVEAGKAVRVIASMTDLEGNPLVTDLTSFGSQSLYRSGYIRRGPSRYSLFTSVRQQGETLWVTVSLGSRFAAASSGTIPIVSGGTGKVALPDGEIVTVTATVRDETPEETARGAWAMAARTPRDGPFERVGFVRPARDPLACGQLSTVC